MLVAETMAFGGSALDRAAHMRMGADPAAANARILPLWQGKLLVDGGALGWLRAGDVLLAGGPPPVFLGLAEGIAWFAQDVPECDSAGFEDLRGVMTALSTTEAELAATAKALLQWHASHGFCAACGGPSVPAMGGWQRDCLACHAKHFPRTDPVVIMLVLDGDMLLVGRSPGWAEGMYSCLAGFVEPGETVEAAVRREVAEETGIAVGQVDYVISQPWPFPASLMLGCRGIATSRDIHIDPVEIEDALWLTRAEAAAALDGTHPRITAPRAGSIARFLISSWVAETQV